MHKILTCLILATLQGGTALGSDPFETAEKELKLEVFAGADEIEIDYSVATFSGVKRYQFRFEKLESEEFWMCHLKFLDEGEALHERSFKVALTKLKKLDRFFTYMQGKDAKDRILADDNRIDYTLRIKGADGKETRLHIIDAERPKRADFLTPDHFIKISGH